MTLTILRALDAICTRFPLAINGGGSRRAFHSFGTAGHDKRARLFLTRRAGNVSSSIYSITEVLTESGPVFFKNRCCWDGSTSWTFLTRRASFTARI
eukprot:6037484-Prorocentrum_lima.AAC.1